MSNPKVQFGSDNTYFLERIIGNDKLNLIIGITSSKNALTILDTGFVGIGTNNPSHLLHVYENTTTSGFTEITSFFANSLTTGALAFKIGQSNTNGNCGELVYTHAGSDNNNNRLDIGFHSTSILSLKNNTGMVGIGTTNPSQQLHTTGDALIAGGNLFLVDTNEKIASDGTDIFFHVNGSETVRFKSGGNVGIGTNNPTQQLHIANDALIVGGNLFLVDTNEKIASDGTDIFFHVNGSETVRFKSGGNVGIGITNPTQKLDITSSTATGNSVNTAVRIGSLSTGAVSNGFGTGLDFTANRNVAEGLGIRTGAIEQWLISGANTSADTWGMRFIVRDDDTQREAITIRNTGNVGIGTTNPTQQLHTTADALIAGGDLFLVDTNEKIASDGTDIFFHVNGSETVRFKSGGNVGIGTNLANNTFRRLLIHSTAATSAGIQMSYDGIGVTSSSGFRISYDGSGNTLLYNYQNTDMYFATNNVERLRILAGGNVGIGTTIPGHLVHVYENTTTTGSLDIFSIFSNALTTGTNRLKIGKSNSTGDCAQINYTHVGTNNTNNRLELGLHSLTVMTLKNTTGFVGIGTTNPTQQLHTTGDALIAGGDLFLVDTNEKIASDGTDIFFHVNGSETVRFKSGGNVGIGTNNPSQRLDVSGGIRANTITLSTGAVNGYILRSDASGNATWVVNSSTTIQDADGDTRITVENSADEDIIRFYTVNSQRMHISSLGNIGIGITNPTQQLHVANDVLIGGGDLFLVDTNEKIGSDGNDIFIHTNGTESLRIGSTGNVGIGTNMTSNTTRILQLHSTSAGRAGIQITYDGIGVTSSSGIRFGYDASGHTILYNYQNSDIYMGTNNVERMRILSGGNIGIGTNNPLSTLDINGSIRTKVTTLTTGTFSLDTTYSIIRANTASGNITLNLPAVSGYTGVEYKIVKTSASNSVTIDANGTELIDGTTTNVVLTALRDRIHIVCDGTEWYTF